MGTRNQSTEIFWTAFKSGDRDAFEAIYRAHAPELLNYGYKVSADKTVIEDSLHDLFVELWQNREGLSETTSVRFYLFKALRYKIMRNLRKNHLAACEDLHSVQPSEVVSSIENILISWEVESEQLAHLRSRLNDLPTRQQEAINLRYFNNFSNEQVAEIMGVNYQSACKFIYTALQKLKDNLRVAVSSFLILINIF